MDSKHAAMASVAPGHWRRVENPDRSRRIDLTFPGAANSAALRAQVDSWLDALERCVERDAALGERAALLIPSLGDSDSTEAPILHFPAPMRVGAGILAGKRDPADVLDVLRRIATALDALHARAFIHGAVGMSSLWWMRDGTLRFADAGLTHLLDGVVSPPKVAGAYLAPEVWRRSGIVPASDQYGLAVVAFELFTGRVRYVEDAANGVQSVQPLTLESGERLYAHAPAELNEVMQRALSASPSARYGSCTEFVEALAGHATLAKSLPTVHRFAGFGVGSRKQTLALLAVTVVVLSASAYVLRAGLKQRPIGIDFDLGGVAAAARDQAGALPTIDVSTSSSRPSSGRGGGAKAGALNGSAGAPRGTRRGADASAGTSDGSSPAATGASDAGKPTPAGTALRSQAEVLARDMKRAVIGTGAAATPTYSTRSSASTGSSGGTGAGGGDASRGGTAPSGGGSGGGTAPSSSTASGSSAGRSRAVTPGAAAVSRPRATDVATVSVADSAAARSAGSVTVPAAATISERVARLIGNTASAPSVPLVRGTLQLKGPSGARFYVDGVLVKPVKEKVTVDEGQHDVDIVIPNGSIYRHRVTILGGQTVLVNP